MTKKIIISFFRFLGVLFILLLSTSLFSAEAGSKNPGGDLDTLVKHEQANVDNEAVSVYGGTVGKLEAVFFIEWTGTGNPVEGFYFYPSRGREKTYVLKGTNPKQDVLNLQEFTVGPGGAQIQSATIQLTKRVTKNRIIWEGTMNNTDGRMLPLTFSRPR